MFGVLAVHFLIIAFVFTVQCQHINVYLATFYTINVPVLHDMHISFSVIYQYVVTTDKLVR